MAKKFQEEVLRIDKTSLEPLYIQVQKLLEKLIATNYFEKKPHILTEKFLIENLNVSRNTIRQAVSKLIEKGLVVSERPRGIIIVQNSSKIMEETVSGLSYTEAAIKLGQTPITEILDFKLIAPPENIISQLLISTSDKVFFCKRVRFNNKIPVFINYFYIPEKIIPNLSLADFGEREYDQSLYYVIERKHGIEILMTVEEIQAISLNAEDAILLKAKENAPVLDRRVLVYSKDSRIICYNETIFSNTYIMKGLVHKRQRL